MARKSLSSWVYDAQRSQVRGDSRLIVDQVMKQSSYLSQKMTVYCQEVRKTSSMASSFTTSPDTRTGWSHRLKFLRVPNSPPSPLRVENPIAFNWYQSRDSLLSQRKPIPLANLCLPAHQIGRLHRLVSQLLGGKDGSFQTRSTVRRHGLPTMEGLDASPSPSNGIKRLESCE